MANLQHRASGVAHAGVNLDLKSPDALSDMDGSSSASVRVVDDE